jgi:hypothetical protein
MSSTMVILAAIVAANTATVAIGVDNRECRNLRGIRR